jgi:hypothetical protein
MIKSPEDITNEIIAIYEKVEVLKRKAQTLVLSNNPADKTTYLALKAEWGVLENKVVDLVIERRHAFRLEAMQEKEDIKESMEPMTHDEEMDLHDSIEDANPSGRDLPDRNEDGEYLNGGGYMP